MLLIIFYIQVYISTVNKDTNFNQVVIPNYIIYPTIIFTPAPHCDILEMICLVYRIKFNEGINWVL